MRDTADYVTVSFTKSLGKMKLSKDHKKIITLLAVWSAIDYCCLTGLKPKQFQRDFYNGLDEYEREIVDEFFNRHLTYLGNKFQEKEITDKISERLDFYEMLKR